MWRHVAATPERIVSAKRFMGKLEKLHKVSRQAADSKVTGFDRRYCFYAIAAAHVLARVNCHLTCKGR